MFVFKADSHVAQASFEHALWASLALQSWSPASIYQVYFTSLMFVMVLEGNVRRTHSFFGHKPEDGPSCWLDQGYLMR